MRESTQERLISCVGADGRSSLGGASDSLNSRLSELVDVDHPPAEFAPDWINNRQQVVAAIRRSGTLWIGRTVVDPACSTGTLLS